MTRKKAGKNPPKGDSANGPNHEAKAGTADGPEADRENASIRQPENDRIQVPDQHTVTGSPGPGRTSTPGSPRIERFLALGPSRFGSPFAYSTSQDKPDFFKGLLDKITCALFDQVVAEAPNLRECLATALKNDGSNGQFCVLKQHPNMKIDSSQKSNGDDSRLGIYCFDPNQNRMRLSMFVDSISAAISQTYVGRSNPVDPIESIDSPSSKNKSSKVDEIIDVCRVRNSKTSDVEYFVVNKNLEYLYINNVDATTTDLDTAVRAGPLPDFAVFDLDYFSVFWWRTPAALDYIPNLKRKRASEDEGEESSRKASKSDTEPLPDLQVFPDSKNWLDEYRRRINLCEARPFKYTKSITELHPPHEHPVGEMLDMDVILAIGAVWLGLGNANVDFAYANSNLFSIARTARMVGMHAVRGSNHFIMPLILNEESDSLLPESDEDTVEPLKPVFSAFQRGEEEKIQEYVTAAESAKQKDPGNKNNPPLSLKEREIKYKAYHGGIGHLMLAIAEKVDIDEGNAVQNTQPKKARVRLRFMDSANGLVNRGLIRRVARNIVRNSGWLGDIWPCFDPKEEDWVEVLGQSVNRCGEHTVLNAWAYMLDIPLAPPRIERLSKTHYDEARRMIRLALRGHLDSLTIRAWMQRSKYAIDESLSQLQQSQVQNPGLPRKLRNMQTKALNEDFFNEIVDYFHTQELPKNQHDATDPGAVPLAPDAVATQQSEHQPEAPAGDTISTGQNLDPGSSAASDTASSTASLITPQLPQFPVRHLSTWQESMVHGLRYYSASRARTLRTTEDPLKNSTTISSFSNMTDYEVILGIAPVWEGLTRLGRADIQFTYAGMDIFSPGRGQQGVGAIGRRSRFIMPLSFPSANAKALEDEGEGQKKIPGVGHLLLCVAELVNDRPLTVQCHLLDSRPGLVNDERIELKVKQIIRSSGWLGTNKSRINFGLRPFMRIPVPNQVGDNTCGLHVIFNAWATMLGISIHPYHLRRGRPPVGDNEAIDQMFVTTGLEIVNLALAGFMDSARIQAFFNVFGYSVEQRFSDPTRAVISVHAVGMNQEKFRRTLQKRYWNNVLACARTHKATFPDDDMAYLMSFGLSVDEAWTALVIGGPDREQALSWHFNQDILLPRPEEALSPKTPESGRLNRP